MTGKPPPAGAEGSFRCSVASRAVDEPLEGTASTVRAFLLLESPGGWGVEVTQDSRLPDEVKSLLATMEEHHRVRPLLIRRPGRRVSEGVRVFAAYMRAERPWMESATLDTVPELLDLDVRQLGEGRSPGLPRYDDPLFLVCTHGRHDACCAERGRPLAAAIADVAPEQTWEVSHIGGDRFSANVLVLPHGLYYGRLAPEDAPRFAQDHLAGRLDLDHLRGRSTYAFSVQAAEIFLRRHLGETSLTPLELLQHTRHGTETVAVFAVRGRRWKVRVHTELGEQRQLTCRALSSNVGPAHRLTSIDG